MSFLPSPKGICLWLGPEWANMIQPLSIKLMFSYSEIGEMSSASADSAAEVTSDEDMSSVSYSR